MKNINRLIKVSADFRELPEDALEWAVVKVERPGLPPLYFDAGETDRMNFNAAAAHAAALRLCGFDDWQVPELPQLETIRELDRFDPACNTTFFPNCKPNIYWTATPVPWSSSVARVVLFSYGLSGYCPHNDEFFVRAVRVGQ